MLIDDQSIRVVASLTTLPDRYDLLIKTLQSIRPQVDQIYLAIPYQARRLNQKYPPVPTAISELCQVIRSPIDYGPAMKLYGALISETQPDTLIVSFDDDVIYPENLVATLVRHHRQQPNTAICGTGALIQHGMYLLSIVSSLAEFKFLNGVSGFAVPPTGRKVDLIFGVAGVLYQRGFFPASIKELHQEIFRHCLANPNVFLNDDVLISGYLSRQKIPRLLFLDIPSVSCQEDNRADALSHDMLKQLGRMGQAFDYLKTQGFYPQTEKMAVDDSIVVRALFAVVILILIGLLCVYFYWFLFHRGEPFF